MESGILRKYGFRIFSICRFPYSTILKNIYLQLLDCFDFVKNPLPNINCPQCITNSEIRKSVINVTSDRKEKQDKNKQDAAQ